MKVKSDDEDCDDSMTTVQLAAVYQVKHFQIHAIVTNALLPAG
jgi:hypothetical protein